MEVTFTRLDENGNEEIVTMSSRDLLDYVKEQEEIAKMKFKRSRHWQAVH